MSEQNSFLKQRLEALAKQLNAAANLKGEYACCRLIHCLEVRPRRGDWRMSCLAKGHRLIFKEIIVDDKGKDLLVLFTPSNHIDAAKYSFYRMNIGDAALELGDFSSELNAALGTTSWDTRLASVVTQAEKEFDEWQAAEAARLEAERQATYADKWGDW